MTPEELADAFLRKYGALSRLQFVLTVIEEGAMADRAVPPREVAYLQVVMAPSRVNAKVYRSRGGEHLLDLVDDGQFVTETTAASLVTHPVRETPRERYLSLADAVRLDGCLVASALTSWLGSEAFAPAQRAEVIRAGRIEGTGTVDGHPCIVVTNEFGAPSTGIVARHHLYLDEREFWLRKRVVEQTTYSATGEALQVIMRTWQYTEFSVPEMADFAPSAPWGPQAGKLQ